MIQIESALQGWVVTTTNNFSQQETRVFQTFAELMFYLKIELAWRCNDIELDEK